MGFGRVGGAGANQPFERRLLAQRAMRPDLVVVSIFRRASSRLRTSWMFRHSARNFRPAARGLMTASRRD